jgi:hypothetical protein
MEAPMIKLVLPAPEVGSDPNEMEPIAKFTQRMVAIAAEAEAYLRDARLALASAARRLYRLSR